MTPAQLPLRKGDIVELLDPSNPDWWLVRLAPGKPQGYVPAAYVKRLADSDVGVSHGAREQRLDAMQ
jgi:hypothetical protein